jgi:hypothetical protein
MSPSANFSRAARFANSLANGKVLSRTQSTSRGFSYVSYQVRLSPDTERGRYDLSNPATTRAKSTGFVIPSNNEWVKSAYCDPKGGGTDSYWAYPTGPCKQPNVAVLNPGTGDVENPSDQPLATYNPNDPNSSSDTPGAATSWRSLTRSRRNRRATTSCGTGITTTAASPMRRPTSWRSRPSATTPRTRPAIPGTGSR